MTIALTTGSFLMTDPVGWSADWAWGLPLIQKIVRSKVGRMIERHHPRTAFVVVVGATTLLATCLHGFEAGFWAVAYRLLGALPDFKTAMLYSLNALTSYGHTSLELQDHWHLMGALEALNGWLLFGLSAAFLFAVIEKVSALNTRSEH